MSKHQHRAAPINLSDDNDTLETVNITGVCNLIFNATSNLTAIDASALQASATIDIMELENGVDLSSLNDVPNVDRIPFYTEGNDVDTDASTLSNLAQIRFADADPNTEDATSVSNDDGIVIGNGNNLDVTITNATADQRIDVIDGGDMDMTAAEGTGRTFHSCQLPQ